MFAFRLGAETIFGVVFFVQLLNVVDVASVNIGAISKGEVISIAAGELNSSNELVAVTSDEGGVGINDLNIVLGTSLVQLIPLDVDSLNGSSAAEVRPSVYVTSQLEMVISLKDWEEAAVTVPLA